MAKAAKVKAKLEEAKSKVQSLTSQAVDNANAPASDNAAAATAKTTGDSASSLLDELAGILNRLSRESPISSLSRHYRRCAHERRNGAVRRNLHLLRLAVSYAKMKEVHLRTKIPLDGLLGLDEAALELLERACQVEEVRAWCVQWPGQVPKYANGLRQNRIDARDHMMYVEAESLKAEQRFALETFKNIMRHGAA
jgi:hypothetical protein